MADYSPSTLRLLGEVAGTGGTSARTSRQRGGLVAIKVADPAAEVIDLVAAVDEKKGRVPSGYLARARNKGSGGQRPSGLITFEGRVCCADHLRGLDRRAHLLRLPYETTCTECGARYSIEVRVHHGR